ncbi:hypothetical protein EV421DRAFT_2042960 [Armillaria borealis]|uniref:DUF6535 domain-containing protein n=1 Tax=Armillaria borealis TaxID=47425 RepID=A0AA39ICM5_9AGAR|nr:hypothetical protein EV421DRAFT_2042960 [Armillaria borealis]
MAKRCPKMHEYGPSTTEEAADFDANMLAEWRDTIDVLLVFAGLFSTVLTTFVVQTSQNLRPDYNKASMFLLVEILKATASNGSQISIPPFPTAFSSRSHSDEWMHSLWFSSLTLSLITALVAVLVKQWLHQYVAVVSDSSARDRARIRHMRYAGLQTWQVPMIIGLLPVLLHVSLALFFAGLAIFLFSLNLKVAWLVSIIGAATYMAYIIALILPLIHPYCPYKVPLTFYVHCLYQFVNDYLIPHIVLMQHCLYTQMFGWRDSLTAEEAWREDFIQNRPRIPTLNEIEYKHVQECTEKVDVQSLLWLHSSTSNTSVHQSVLQAISGMTSNTLGRLPEVIKSLALSPDANGELDELELYCRALSLLCSHPIGDCSTEQLKMVLYSTTSTEKASAFFLRILRGPQRSSLTLHSVVWKILVDATISSPPISSGALELELELMEILTSFSSASESGDFTTIDKPTDELRRHILGNVSPSWGHHRIQFPTTTISSIRIDTTIAFVSSIQHRFRNSVYVSDRKQQIEASLAIIKHTGLLIPTLDRKEADMVLDALYSLLCSETFAVVGDLRALVHRIFMIFYDHRPQFESSILSQSLFYIRGSLFASVTYQCYLHSLAGDDGSSENDTILPILEHFLLFCWSIYEDTALTDLPRLPTFSDRHGILAFSYLYPLTLLHYGDEQLPDHFRIDSLVETMLLLIKGHNESILYGWAQLPIMRCVWLECLPRLVQWSLGEQFRRWDFLKRVLAIVVIGRLQSTLGYCDNKESLPQYDYEVYMIVANELPWLHEVSSSGSSRCAYFSLLIHVPV